MCKRLVPFFLVVLAAALWSWTQRPQTPLVWPKRDNCWIHHVYLGAIIHYPYWQVGSPDSRKDCYPKSRNEFTVWTWEKHKQPELQKLEVILQHQHVVRVVGTDLVVGSKEYSLKAGAPLSEARFLGSPTETVQEGEGLKSTWKFPEVDISVYSDRNQRVTLVEIRNP